MNKTDKKIEREKIKKEYWFIKIKDSGSDITMTRDEYNTEVQKAREEAVRGFYEYLTKGYTETSYWAVSTKALYDIYLQSLKENE